MRFSPSISTAFAASLASFASGFGLRSDLTKGLQLAAELGLDSDLLLKDPPSFRTAVTQVNTPAEYVLLPIDHDNPAIGTFRNRYWVNDAYYVPGGPVMLYDVGEADGERSSAHLTSKVSFFPPLLQEFGAIGIVWEHRYYGDSLPYPINNHTPPERWKYLTTRQALADIPTFAENFTRPGLQKYDLTPGSTPWVMIGGSYPGARAAFARNEYPDTIFASFATSAPVQAQINMSVYHEQIYRSMVANGFRNCASDIHAALDYIDDQLSREDTAATVKQLFFGAGAEKNSNEDFTLALAMIYGSFQAYGIDGPAGSLGEFCRYLESDPVTGQTAGASGLAFRLGNRYLAERWAAWPIFTPLINVNYETNCKGLNKSAAPSCELNKPVTDASAIAWTWQYCTQWGFYQSNNEGIHSLLSRYQTLEYQQVRCNRQFPDAVKNGLLPPQPQVDALNTEFGGWNIRPSNVYFSAGEFDPWRTLTLLSAEQFSLQLNVTSDIPRCGVRTSPDTVFGYVGANQVHCFDFQSGSYAGEVSRGYFRRALKEWLPCFEKQQ
ncbi:serine carboxypeptidase S28-domain-containing protein [Aspergillus similis]